MRIACKNEAVAELRSSNSSISHEGALGVLSKDKQKTMYVPQALSIQSPLEKLILSKYRQDAPIIVPFGGTKALLYDSFLRPLLQKIPPAVNRRQLPTDGYRKSWQALARPRLLSKRLIRSAMDIRTAPSSGVPAMDILALRILIAISAKYWR